MTASAVNVDVTVSVACKREDRGCRYDVSILPAPAATAHTRQLGLMGHAVQDPVVSLRSEDQRCICEAWLVQFDCRRLGSQQ